MVLSCDQLPESSDTDIRMEQYHGAIPFAGRLYCSLYSAWRCGGYSFGKTVARKNIPKLYHSNYLSVGAHAAYMIFRMNDFKAN